MLTFLVAKLHSSVVTADEKCLRPIDFFNRRHRKSTQKASIKFERRHQYTVPYLLKLLANKLYNFDRVVS